MLRAARALGVMPAAHIGPVGEGQLKTVPCLTYIEIGRGDRYYVYLEPVLFLHFGIGAARGFAPAECLRVDRLPGKESCDG